MNNNYQLSQAVFNSGIHFPTQISQNLNYFVYLTIDNPPIQNLNNNPFCSAATFENTITHHDNFTSSNDIPMAFNYNPFINYNYAAINELFNNHNYYLSKLSQNNLPSNQGVSLLNSKRKRSINDIEKCSKLNKDFCEKKNGIIENSIISVKDSVVKIKGKSEEKKESNEFFELGKGKKLMESENKESFEKKSKKNEKQKNEKNKKYWSKKKKMCQELLQDSFLEHFSEIENKTVTLDEKLPVVVTNSNAKKKLQNTQNKPDKKKEKEKSSNQNDNNKILYKKINKNEEHNINFQPTKVIYHGNNYEKTNNIKDFMKYNFNFCVEEQYKSKKLIVDYENQHVNLEELNNDLFKINNLNNTNELNIKAKWLRSKFQGDNHQLKRAINLIQEILKSNRNTIEQEKCLDIIRINGYNMGEISKFKCM